MKVAVVVLHYKVESVTIECVDKLLKQKNCDVQVIIVDNASNNGSFEKLKNRYSNNEKVYLVGIETNMGFAKANDLGYQIAKHKFEADIIPVINNDLFIEDDEFVNKLEQLYHEEPFEILGPDIINLNGEHQNPLKECVRTLKQVNRAILLTKIKLLLIKLIYKPKKHKSNNGEHVDQPLNNVPLHGSCLIFGRKYIEHNEFPFCPDTFLFGEEDILFFRASRKGINTLYYPLLVVYHMEDVSTKSVLATSKTKRLFELENSLYSLKVLRNLMKETNTY